MQTSDFKNLKVWQHAMDITINVYSMVKLLPDFERYSLSDQIRRSAISIPSNIAEGQGRNSNKEFAHFLSISRGSIAELQTQLILCVKIGYIPDDLINPILLELSQLDRMICGLMNFLKSEKK